jgi:hypothetical protein
MSAGVFANLARDPAFRRQRRVQLMASSCLTGLDWIELVGANAGKLRLKLHFVPSRYSGKEAVPSGIAPSNILVTASSGGGAAVHAASVDYLPKGGSTLLVDVHAGPDDLGGDEAGVGLLEIQGLENVDPLFARASFPLTRGGRAAIDPLRPAQPPDAEPSAASIDYLAKDFHSFRRLMLDHMAARAPDWQERHVADIGIVLVEILAYAADYLSYFQDAVATEAYLSTARRRISVRRHARMLDYRTYENCAARVWLQVDVKEDGTLLRGFRAFCDVPGSFPNRFDVAGATAPVQPTGQSVFETIEDAELRVEHNCLPLYDFDVSDFRVPAGATSAVLDGAFPCLKKNDVLIFASYLGGPTSPSSARPHSTAYPVRLARDARVTRDPLTERPITEIVWADGDALPSDLTVARARPDGKTSEGFAAWGNVVAADAGLTVRADRLTLQKDRRGIVSAQLHFPDVIYSVPYDRNVQSSAAAFLKFDPRDAVPAVQLQSATGDPQSSERWSVRRDLLDSDRFACDFRAETDDSGVTTLRFGDGVHGAQPAPGTQFSAIYRTGGGDNEVGAYTICSWERRPDDAFVRAVTNPLAACGGAGRQPIREIRRDAPESFRNLLHCAIPDDFVVAIQQDARVRAAVTEARWVGSRNTLCVYVQRAGRIETDAAFLAEIEAKLDERRLLGSDVALYPPRYVPLQISFTISVKPSYAQHAVRRKVADAVEELYRFGRPSFGEAVYLSTLMARAMDVPGVDDVKVEEFRRFGRPPLGEIEAGRIDIGPIEIALLDNPVDAASHGRLIVRAVAAEPAGRT